ncbi:putative zinc-binding metallopeptidase [Pedobacter jeongneungensis]|uniref:zinc-binding metallopeptidase n=1 Tax=Pedobacter jeongneungensis TaxID=947309 RepID=UPI00046AD90F|nr:putative zinc-binding metallopeptidase [Pedobacter jeongneungensis]
MKKIFKISLLALVVSVAVSSCKKDKTLNANLDAIDRNNTVKSDIDNWLTTNYLNPYNIEVKYRFDPFEADLDKDITPPKESQVIPAMETVRDIWIKPYEKVGGPNFMKIYTPKQFYLVGSPSYNGDGTITLGTAEGGKKIVLYVINNFSKSNTAATSEMIHVIEHEFTHILNQKVAYDVNFDLVTKADYTANWNIPSQAVARTLGFITQYSRSNPLEDFAEMTSIMLQYGKAKYDATVNALTADSQTKLRKKEAFVVDYFKKAFNIDFYALQAEVTAATDRNAPPLYTAIGTGKTYTTLTASPSTQTPQSPEFLALWNTAKTAMTAQGFGLTTYSMLFGANNLVTIRYTFTQGTNTFSGDADYTISFDANGTATLTLNSVQPTSATYSNYGIIKTSLAGLAGYVANNKFNIDYAPNFVPGTKGLPGAFGAFYKSTDPTSFIIGTLN